MEIISVTKENLEEEHICCAISSNKDCQVIAKKSWLEERFDEGLVFLKGNVGGKCFIEYIPAESAWCPIEAEGYMYIDCLWVSGQFKGKGYSNLLLEECIQDSKKKAKKGIVILSSKKKLGYLADYKYLTYKGFETVDSVQPYFELMCLKFAETENLPHFKSALKGEDKNANMQLVHIETGEDARKVPSPFTTFCLFYNGEFVTHEILSEKKFEKILESKGY